VKKFVLLASLALACTQPAATSDYEQLATTASSAAGGSTSGTGDRTVSITPQVQQLLVVFASVSGNTQAAPTMTDNKGGTYTLVAQASWNGGADNSFAYVRDTLATARVAHTIKLDTDTNTAGELAVIAVTDMSRTGAAAVKQVATAADQSASTTPAITFANATLSANPVVGAIASGDQTTTPPTGWSEKRDASQLTPTTALEVATKDTGHASASVTWGATQSTGYAAIALELDTSPPDNDLGFAHGIVVHGYGSAVSPAKLVRNTTTGSTLLLVMAGNHGDIDNGPSDSYGNTWSLVDIDDYSDWAGYGSAVWVATNATGGSDHVFTQSVTAWDEITMFLVEIPNAGATPTVLSSFTQKSNGVGGTTIASSPITTSGPARLVSFWSGSGTVGNGNHSASTGTATPLDGYGFDEANGYVQAFDEFEDQASAGTYGHTWTYTPAQGAQAREIAIQP
jgi:hypothetical protein